MLSNTIGVRVLGSTRRSRGRICQPFMPSSEVSSRMAATSSLAAESVCSTVAVAVTSQLHRHLTACGAVGIGQQHSAVPELIVAGALRSGRCRLVRQVDAEG